MSAFNTPTINLENRPNIRETVEIRNQLAKTGFGDIFEGRKGKIG